MGVGQTVGEIVERVRLEEQKAVAAKEGAAAGIEHASEQVRPLAKAHRQPLRRVVRQVRAVGVDHHHDVVGELRKGLAERARMLAKRKLGRQHVFGIGIDPKRVHDVGAGRGGNEGGGDHDGHRPAPDEIDPRHQHAAMGFGGPKSHGLERFGGIAHLSRRWRAAEQGRER